MKGSKLYVVLVLATTISFSFAELCDLEKQPGWYKCQGLSSLAELASLPDSVVGLKLVKSNISNIPSDAFSRFAGSLIELRITGCSLEKIEDDAFKSLDKLETLDLSNNRIVAIETSWIRGLSNLKELIVFKNQIRKIDSEFYGLLPKLELLDIAYNELVDCIAESNIKKLTNLKLILIAGNPWSYRCRSEMTYMLKRSNVNWIKDWSVGDLLIEECLAHEPNAKTDDAILKKCVDRKSFESIGPILPNLEKKVEELSSKVEELKNEVNDLKKKS
ncbi:phospholipase A2 inhibitor-like [Vespa velutina]|uniref:phospholipase A2 inhibitor-like n=1 Tax=Vespa velutina TaxID=202808 RepID=UPI001FB29BD0|nr:phospholipase A2 inhibitor-like [Vespa velutina]